MTLKKAIKRLKAQAEIMDRYNNTKEIAKEYRQIAKWLKELKDYREELRTCENCRHEHKAETEYPCSICRCNHPNKFEWKKGGAK